MGWWEPRDLVGGGSSLSDIYIYLLTVFPLLIYYCWKSLLVLREKLRNYYQLTELVIVHRISIIVHVAVSLLLLRFGGAVWV